MKATLKEKMERVTAKVKETVETTRKRAGVTNFFVSGCIVIYMAGLMIFHAYANFELDAWNNAYYLWHIGKDLFFWFALLCVTEGFELVICTVIIYTFCRLCLEILTIILKTGPNVWFAVDLLFLVLLVIIVLLSIIQSIKK